MPVVVGMRVVKVWEGKRLYDFQDGRQGSMLGSLGMGERVAEGWRDRGTCVTAMWRATGNATGDTGGAVRLAQVHGLLRLSEYYGSCRRVTELHCG